MNNSSVDVCGRLITGVFLGRRSSGILDGSVGSDELLLDEETPHKMPHVIPDEDEQAEIPPILTGVERSGSR